MTKVFIGNIYKCTEFSETKISIGESSIGRVSFEQEIIKENATLIKQGHNYLDMDDSQVLISGETIGPRYRDQIYVIEDELFSYQPSSVIKSLENVHVKTRIRRDNLGN